MLCPKSGLPLSEMESDLLRSGNLLLTKLPIDLADGIIQDIEKQNNGIAILIRKCLTEPVLMANELNNLLMSGRYLLTKLPNKISDEILQDLENSRNPVSMLIKQALSDPVTIAQNLCELANSSCYLLTRLSSDQSYDIVKDLRKSSHPVARLMRKCLADGCSPRNFRDLDLDDDLAELLKSGKYLLSLLPQNMYDEVAKDLSMSSSVTAIQIRSFSVLSERLEPESVEHFPGTRHALDLSELKADSGSLSVSARGMLEDLVESILQQTSNSNTVLTDLDSPAETPTSSELSDSNDKDLCRHQLSSINYAEEQLPEDQESRASKEPEQIQEASTDQRKSHVLMKALPVSSLDEVSGFAKVSSKKHIFEQRDPAHGLSPVVEDECNEYDDNTDGVFDMPAPDADNRDYAALDSLKPSVLQEDEYADEFISDSGSSESIAGVMSDDDASHDSWADMEDTYRLSDSGSVANRPHAATLIAAPLSSAVGRADPRAALESAARPPPQYKTEASGSLPRADFEADSEVAALAQRDAAKDAGERLDASRRAWMHSASESTPPSRNPGPTETADVQVLRYANGDVYEGSLRGGVREGYGVYTWRCGDVYAGEWAGGRKSGEGSYAWVRGGWFAGSWAGGRQHGRGRFELANGMVYEGRWTARDAESMPGAAAAGPMDLARSRSAENVRAGPASPGLMAGSESPGRRRSPEQGHPYRDSLTARDLSFEAARAGPRPQTSLSLASSASTQHVSRSGSLRRGTAPRDRRVTGRGGDVARSDEPEPRARWSEGAEAAFKALAQHYGVPADSDARPALKRKQAAEKAADILTLRAQGGPFCPALVEQVFPGVPGVRSGPSLCRSQALFRKVFRRSDWTRPEARLTPDSWPKTDESSEPPHLVDVRQAQLASRMRDMRRSAFRVDLRPTLEAFARPEWPEAGRGCASRPGPGTGGEGAAKRADECRAAADRLRSLLDGHAMRRGPHGPGGASELEKLFCEWRGGAGAGAEGRGLGVEAWAAGLVRLEVLGGGGRAGVVSRKAACRLFAGSASALRLKRGGGAAEMTLREFEAALFRLEGLLHAAQFPATARPLATAASAGRTQPDPAAPARTVPAGASWGLPGLERRSDRDGDGGCKGSRLRALGGAGGGGGWGMGLVARNRRSNLAFSDPFRDPFAEHLPHLRPGLPAPYDDRRCAGLVAIASAGAGAAVPPGAQARGMAV